MPVGRNVGNRRYIENYRYLGDPLTNDQWRVTEMPSFLSNSPPLLGGEIIPSIKSVQMNYGNTPTDAVAGGGTNAYYALGLNDIDGFDIVFHLNRRTAGLVLAYFDFWKSIVVRSDGLRGLPRDYKQDVKMEYTDGTVHRHLFAYTYSGCWPTTTAPLTFESNSPPEVMEFTQSFSVDSGTYEEIRHRPLDLRQIEDANE